MACYTLSECVLEHLDEGREYTSVLLNTFAQENDHRIAIDNGNKIKEIYTVVAKNLPDNGIKLGVLSWLYLMTTFKPQKWEFIEIENFDDVFLEVCKNTIDKKMIVSSENNCRWKKGISADKLYLHEGASIRILNKDEAILELKPKTTLFQQNNTNTNTNTNTNK